MPYGACVGVSARAHVHSLHVILILIAFLECQESPDLSFPPAPPPPPPPPRLKGLLAQTTIVHVHLVHNHVLTTVFLDTCRSLVLHKKPHWHMSEICHELGVSYLKIMITSCAVFSFPSFCAHAHPWCYTNTPIGTCLIADSYKKRFAISIVN